MTQLRTKRLVTESAAIGRVNAWRDCVDKIRNQQQAVNILDVGDSTSDRTSGPSKWTTGWAARIGALFPTHTVYEHVFDYTTTNNWLAATLIQTGTGYRSDLASPPQIHVWIAGYAGHNWSDWLVDSRRDLVFGDTVNPDVIVIPLGHNDGVNNMDPSVIRARDLAYIEWMRELAPHAQIILCAQNPRIGKVTVPTALSPGHAELRNDIYRSLARQRGYGYINITQAFYDDGRSLVPGAAGGLIDDPDVGVHPTSPDGYMLWQDTVMQQIQQAAGAVPLAQCPPLSGQLTKRVIGMDVRPVLSNGWTGSNVTEAVETTIVRNGAATSVKLTKTAAGSAAYVQRTVPLAAVKGKDVTFTVWVYVPSGTPALNTTVGWLLNGSLYRASLVDQIMVDQWYPIALTMHVPTTATSLSVRLWADNSTNSGTPSMYVDPDSANVVLGSLPIPCATVTASVTGLAGVSTYATGTAYSAGNYVSYQGTIYQALTSFTSGTLRGDIAAGNLAQLGAAGRVETLDPGLAAGYNTFPSALRAYYFRAREAGAISKLDLDIGVQSGNIIAAVYANNGSQGRAAAPGTLLASTGALACPAVGFAQLSLGSTIGVAAGDWIMLSADNTTVKFRTPTGFAGAAGLSTGRVGYEVLGSLAAPTSPNPTVWAPTYMPIIVGE